MRKREAGNQLTPGLGEDRLIGRRKGGPIGKPRVRANAQSSQTCVIIHIGVVFAQKLGVKQR